MMPFKIGDRVMDVISWSPHFKQVGTIVNVNEDSYSVMFDYRPDIVPRYTSASSTMIIKEDKGMNKIEALKLCLEGKKVANKNWTAECGYLSFNGARFIYNFSSLPEPDLPSLYVMDWDDGWYVVLQPKFKVGQFVSNHAGDIGIIREVKEVGSDICYMIEFTRGRLTKVYESNYTMSLFE